MKFSIKRCALAIIMCGVSLAAFAQTSTIYSEDFSSENNGYKVIGDGYSVLGLSVGHSAKLSFRYSCNTATNILTVETYKNGSPKKTYEFTARNNEWQTAEIPIAVGLNSNNILVNIYFGGLKCYIDDIVVESLPTITMDEGADNSAVLTANLNQIVDIATVRNLRAGIWNTLCLPFDVDRATLNQAFGEVQETKMTTFSSYSSEVMTFTAAGNKTTIPAGTPFLLKILKGYENPTFFGVTIKTAEPQTVTKGGVSFCGVFSPTALSTTGSDLFIGTDNFLYQPAEGTNTINGLRAYISRTGNARISLSLDDEAAGVMPVASSMTSSGSLFTLQGQCVLAPRRGLYVRDGKKVIIK